MMDAHQVTFGISLSKFMFVGRWAGTNTATGVFTQAWHAVLHQVLLMADRVGDRTVA